MPARPGRRTLLRDYEMHRPKEFSEMAALQAAIDEQVDEIAAFYKRSILAARADGTAPRGVDPNDTARLLLGVLLGIRVLARSAPNRSLLEGVVRPALALLDSPHHKRKKTR